MAVPEVALRQIVAEQAELATDPELRVNEPTEGPHDSIDSRVVKQVARSDADHRRTFLTAARELARIDAEIDSIRSESLCSWILCDAVQLSCAPDLVASL